MRTSPYRKFIHIVLSLLMVNATVCCAVFYLFYFEPGTINRLDEKIVTAHHQTIRKATERILSAAKDDPDEAYKLALDLRRKLQPIKIGDYFWNAKKSNFSFLVKIHIDRNDYEQAAAVLDEWKLAHSRDLSLLNLQVETFAQLPDRHKDLINVLEERARRFPSNKIFVQTYVKQLITEDNFEPAADMLVRYMIHSTLNPLGEWRVYVRGRTGFNEKTAKDTRLKTEDHETYTDVIDLSSDVTVIRLDPSNDFPVLKKVRLDVLTGGKLWETLSLAPEFSPVLHMMAYDSIMDTYVITDNYDPYFTLELKKPVPEGARLKITIDAEDDQNSDDWVYEYLAKIPSPVISKAVSNHHWETVPVQALEIQQFFADRDEAAICARMGKNAKAPSSVFEGSDQCL